GVKDMKLRLGLLWERLVHDNLIARWLKYRSLTVVYGYFTFQALSTAVQFDLFTLLAEKGRMRRSEIAKALAISEKSARTLLSLLHSVDMVKTTLFSSIEDPVYESTYFGKHYLNRNSPLQITSIIESFHFISYKAMYHYYESLKTGRNVGLDELP